MTMQCRLGLGVFVSASLHADRYRDDTSSVVSIEQWKAMARAMDLAKMGGPARVIGKTSAEMRRGRTRRLDLQVIVLLRDHDVQDRHQENADEKAGEQPAYDHERKWSLGI